jgi:MoxR-like ATPase
LRVSLRDLTDPNAVVKAIAEFDEIGRDAFLDKYGFSPAREFVLVRDGRAYDSKAIVGAAHGFQWPDVGPLDHAEFNGGEQTTYKLRRLGFAVERWSDFEAATEPPAQWLAQFLDRYAGARNETFSGSHEAAELLKHAADAIGRDLPADLRGARVRPSVGQGNWAASPWIAVLDPRITTTTQEGVYPVVLIREDLAGLYVTIAQGVTKLKREHGHAAAYEALRERARGLRPNLDGLPLRGFSGGDDVFLGDSTLARDYAVSVITSKYFPREGLELSSINEDLVAVNEAYATLIRDGVIGEAPDASSATEERVLCIYVGDRAQANFEAGGRQGWWGWKRAPREAEHVNVGDLIAFASGFTGGSPRVNGPEWQRHDVDRVVVGRIDKPPFRTDEAIMPDEHSGEAEYPWKLRFTILGEETDVSLQPGHDLNASTIEALRLSAIAQGRGGVAPVAGSPLLEPYLASEPPLRGTTSPADVRSLADAFATDVEQSGMRLDRDQIVAFLAGVLAKPFAILTGQSGSGKTQLAMRLGEWCGHDAGGRPRALVVPVRPDWTGPEFLFGYPDALANRIDDRVVWAVPAALEFLLRAHHDPAAPYVLILDEMNLAHVERYFADFLSGIESRQPVVPNLVQRGGRWIEAESGGQLPLPSNVIVVGTVNVDETTYMFSPKVLDRAFVHEFRVSSEDLDPALRRPTPCQPASKEVQRHVVRLLQNDDWHFDHPHPDQAVLIDNLKRLHVHLASVNLDFGHRVLFEALRFASIASGAGLGGTDSVLDYIVMTKMLPKVHGSRQRLETRLLALKIWADGEEPDAPDQRLIHAAAKLERMLDILRDAQFVTFTE